MTLRGGEDPGAPPLNLKELEAHLNDPDWSDTWREEGLKLLRALRETRAALVAAQYWIGWRPEADVRIEQCEAVHKQARQVLQGVIDE